MFTYKEVVFCLACCTVCNNLTLFSLLSFTICLALFSPHLFLYCCSYLLFYATATRWRITPLFLLFCFVSLTFHHCSSLLSPFLPLLSVSLSVMAYQDGFYGAADLYVSIYLYSTASLLFSPCCLWVFKYEMAKNKPIEMFTFQMFAFSTFRHLLLILTRAFIPFKGTKF